MCPSMEKWINKVWYRKPLENHSAIKKKKNHVTSKKTDRTGNQHIKQNMPDMER
jgi:hypothetical protein